MFMIAHKTVIKSTKRGMRYVREQIRERSKLKASPLGLNVGATPRKNVILFDV